MLAGDETIYKSLSPLPQIHTVPERGFYFLHLQPRQRCESGGYIKITEELTVHPRHSKGGIFQFTRAIRKIASSMLPAALQLIFAHEQALPLYIVAAELYMQACNLATLIYK